MQMVFALRFNFCPQNKILRDNFYFFILGSQLSLVIAAYDSLYGSKAQTVTEGIGTQAEWC